jgi:hypothetical protein
MTIFAFYAMEEFQRRLIEAPIKRYFADKAVKNTLMRWKHHKAIPVVDELSRFAVKHYREPGQKPTFVHAQVRGRGLTAARALLQTSTIEHLIDAAFYYFAHMQRKIRREIGLTPLPAGKRVAAKPLSSLGSLFGKGLVRRVNTYS